MEEGEGISEVLFRFNLKWNFILNTLCFKQFIGSLGLVKPLPSECYMQTVSIDNFYREMLNRNNLCVSVLLGLECANGNVK